MNEIYVINGYPGCGKTTFGRLVCNELTGQGINFLHTSSIDPIKHIMMPRSRWSQEMIHPNTWDEIEKIKRSITPHEWDGTTKDVYWRGVMSRLKLSVQDVYPNLIHQFVSNQAQSVPSPGVVFVDIREPENIDGFKDYCHSQSQRQPVFTVFVRSDLREEFDNVSDGSVEKYHYDYEINNPRNIAGSMEYFQLEVSNFCQPIIARARTL